MPAHRSFFWLISVLLSSVVWTVIPPLKVRLRPFVSLSLSIVVCVQRVCTLRCVSLCPSLSVCVCVCVCVCLKDTHWWSVSTAVIINEVVRFWFLSLFTKCVDPTNPGPSRVNPAFTFCCCFGVLLPFLLVSERSAASWHSCHKRPGRSTTCLPASRRGWGLR